MRNPDHLDIREAEEILANLTAGGSLPVSPERLANQAAEDYLTSTHNDKPGEPVYLDLLCTLAVSDSKEVSSIAVSCLYRKIIESFCDDFTAQGAEKANRALTHLIRFASQTSGNNSLDQHLAEAGLHTDTDLFKRWQEISTPAPISSKERKNVRRIIIPSRVSAGADVVITSIMVHRILVSFPNAEISLLGSGHLAEIFHNIPRVSHQLFKVLRHGSLMDRILFWPRLEKCVADITDGYSKNEIMIFDPDSRLSQLGLLPLAANSRTCHFPSRSMSLEGGSGSLSEITNVWLDTLLGTSGHLLPHLSLSDEKVDTANSFLTLLRQHGCERITVANFGAGGDERKQLADPFEEKVLGLLLDREKSIIILDMGCGSEEKDRIEKLIAKAAQASTATALTNDKEMACFNPGFTHGIIGVCTSIGSLAALIAGADCYVGYDSSGQHLATAVSTPAVSVFAGYPNERFLERWSPAKSNTANTVLPVPDPAPKFLAAIDELAGKTAEAINHYL